MNQPNNTTTFTTLHPKIRRIVCMALDYFIMCLIVIPFWIVIIVSVHNKLIDMPFDAIQVGFFSILFIILNKDFFNAKSLAKRLMGYQIMDMASETPASALQCFVRNLTISVAWPLEVLITLYNPRRRLGDYLAHTKVVVADTQPLKSIFEDMRRLRFQWGMLLIPVIGIAYFYGLNWLVS